ncbi:RDD family protein [Kiloniella laminariae]|uniref:RDD family protein n=1 Tax=Kiloniella laminariae TaxID=454162 RepID=UPI0012F7DCC8|nr:RDD family protein [Kiloniella laminariae]
MKELPSLSLKASERQITLTVRPSDVEGVPLKRALAYLIDFCFLAVLGVAAFVAGMIINIISLWLLSPLVAIALALLPLAYHSYFLSQKGATPGMKIMDIRMVTLEGKKPSLLHAAITTVIFYVTVPVTSFLILLVILFNDEQRTLHDILTGTIVIREQAVFENLH